MDNSNRIEKMIEEILKNEGGFVNHPSDKGGATNFGVTQKTLSKWLKKEASVEDVKNMSRETAISIYRNEYYFSPGINELPEEIQIVLLDCSVNHGPRRAIKLLQGVLQKLGSQIKADGIIGPKTIDGSFLAHKEMENYFINAIVDERNNFYHRIVHNDNSQEVFLKGWIRRSESFRKEV